ncbi:spore germination protein [Lentibacillus sp. Marseille-P4043]|uniref:spore germination protein n=1 Tax=Lentibacillus sp. Marseille-P4043 TaxID=2040293 RepID=UPI00131A4E01|nr:spore germination protein [Lentibacillus sp. Marseille-P4043]
MNNPLIRIGSIKITNMTGNASITIGEMTQLNPKYEDQSQGTNCAIGDSSSSASIMENKQTNEESKGNDSSSQSENKVNSGQEEATIGSAARRINNERSFYGWPD